MSAVHAVASEASTLARILRPDVSAFPPEAAREILAPDFDQVDKDRMRELSAGARAGTPTAEDDADAGRYELVGHLPNIPRPKARRSLVVR